MSNQPHHDKWSDLLRPSYDYPEDVTNLDDGLTRRQRRKSRRKAKRDWRAADQAAKNEFIAQRKAEPVSQEARLGFAILLAVIVAAGAIFYGVRSAGGDDAAPAAAASPSPMATDEAAEPSETATSTPTESAEDDQAAALTVDETADQWAQEWFTFTPTTGDSQDARLERAQPFMTDELAAFLWEDDAVATAYEAEGTNVEVSGVDVDEAPKGAAPPDTDVRATRQVTVHSTYTAGPDDGQSVDSPYLVTFIRTDDTAPWRVADYTGQEH